MNLQQTIRRILREEITSSKIYYRATTEFIGDDIVLEPKGFYEAFDEEGKPMFHTDDIFVRSNIAELSASKTIGGAILGLWSMVRHKGVLKKNMKIFIYEINEKPEVDLSHVLMDDFPWLKEVRYRKPVHGKYIGYFVYDNEFNRDADNFYTRLSSEDPWELEEVDIEKWEEFENKILTMSNKDLN